jgi:mannosyltransferase OCH1-like enzyme
MKTPPLKHIPQVIHFIWIGPRPFPEKSIPNVISWIQHHPDWEIIFWTDSDDRNVPVPGMKKRLVQEYDFGALSPLLAQSTVYCEKTDMMRYTILFKEGGVYADHDIWCDKSVDPLSSHFDFVVGLDPAQEHPGIESNVIPNNSIIISRAGHPILLKTIETIIQGWDSATQMCPGTDQKSIFERVMRRTLSPFVSSIKNCRNLETRNIILTDIYFYSHKAFTPEELENLRQKGYIYAIHKHVSG